MSSNANISDGAVASNPKHFVDETPEKIDLREEFKRLLNTTVAPDVADFVVRSVETVANDLMQDDDPNALIDLLDSPVAPSMRYNLLTDADLCRRPPIQWRIKNVLPEQGIAVAYGPSGSGKSFLVLDMLQSLASGREWFGRKVKQCSVTYIVLEGEAGLAGRVSAHRLQHGQKYPPSF